MLYAMQISKAPSYRLYKRIVLCNTSARHPHHFQRATVGPGGVFKGVLLVTSDSFKDFMDAGFFKDVFIVPVRA